MPPKPGNGGKACSRRGRRSPKDARVVQELDVGPLGMRADDSAHHDIPLLQRVPDRRLGRMLAERRPLLAPGLASPLHSAARRLGGWLGWVSLKGKEEVWRQGLPVSIACMARAKQTGPCQRSF